MRVWLRWLAVGFVALLASVGLGGVGRAAAALPSVGAAPVLNTPTVSGSSVTLSWIDRSTHEDSFTVVRRWSDGQRQSICDCFTGDKAGTGTVRTFVDTTPDAVPGGVGLRCYQIIAYDFNALFDPSLSRDLCVNGGLDPYDPQTFSRIAAPSLDRVQVSGTKVTVSWTDRSTNEDKYLVRRRDTSVPNFLVGNSNGGEVVANPASTSRSGLGQHYTFVYTAPISSHRWCYTVASYTNSTDQGNPSNEVCTQALPAVAAPAPGLGTINTPDLIGAADLSRISGVTSSVTIGTDGLPLVSYHLGGSSSPGKLVVAHCDDVSCTTATTTDIDALGDVGYDSSIKIGTDGLGIMAYRTYRYGPNDEDLKVAHCSDVACTAATVTTLDSLARVDAKTSLAIASDGLPTIAYQDDPNYNTAGAMTAIKVIHCANVACTSIATSKTIDSVPANPGSETGEGGAVSLAASPTGRLYFAYLSSTNVLKTATCFDPSCSVGLPYIAEQALAGDATGLWPSIAIGPDDLPLISYERSGGLSVAHCVNISCSGVTVATIDVGGDHEQDSIAIGADGLGVISYFDANNKNLQVAHCADAACSTATTITIDEFGDTGRQTSIAIATDGLPVISYLSVTENTWKFAHCPDAGCTGTFVVPFLTRH